MENKSPESSQEPTGLDMSLWPESLSNFYNFAQAALVPIEESKLKPGQTNETRIEKNTQTLLGIIQSLSFNNTIETALDQDISNHGETEDLSEVNPYHLLNPVIPAINSVEAAVHRNFLPSIVNLVVQSEVPIESKSKALKSFFEAMPSSEQVNQVMLSKQKEKEVQRELDSKASEAMGHLVEDTSSESNLHLLFLLDTLDSLDSNTAVAKRIASEILVQNQEEIEGKIDSLNTTILSANAIHTLAVLSEKARETYSTSIEKEVESQIDQNPNLLQEDKDYAKKRFTPDTQEKLQEHIEFAKLKNLQEIYTRYSLKVLEIQESVNSNQNEIDTLVDFLAKELRSYGLKGLYELMDAHDRFDMQLLGSNENISDEFKNRALEFNSNMSEKDRLQESLNNKWKSLERIRKNTQEVIDNIYGLIEKEQVSLDSIYQTPTKAQSLEKVSYLDVLQPTEGLMAVSFADRRVFAGSSLAVQDSIDLFAKHLGIPRYIYSESTQEYLVEKDGKSEKTGFIRYGIFKSYEHELENTVKKYLVLNTSEENGFAFYRDADGGSNSRYVTFSNNKKCYSNEDSREELNAIMLNTNYPKEIFLIRKEDSLGNVNNYLFSSRVGTYRGDSIGENILDSYVVTSIDPELFSNEFIEAYNNYVDAQGDKYIGLKMLKGVTGLVPTTIFEMTQKLAESNGLTHAGAINVLKELLVTEDFLWILNPGEVVFNLVDILSHYLESTVDVHGPTFKQTRQAGVSDDDLDHNIQILSALLPPERFSELRLRFESLLGDFSDFGELGSAELGRILHGKETELMSILLSLELESRQIFKKEFSLDEGNTPNQNLVGRLKTFVENLSLLNLFKGSNPEKDIYVEGVTYTNLAAKFSDGLIDNPSKFISPDGQLLFNLLYESLRDKATRTVENIRDAHLEFSKSQVEKNHPSAGGVGGVGIKPIDKNMEEKMHQIFTKFLSSDNELKLKEFFGERLYDAYVGSLRQKVNTKGALQPEDSILFEASINNLKRVINGEVSELEKELQMLLSEDPLSGQYSDALKLRPLGKYKATTLQGEEIVIETGYRGLVKDKNGKVFLYNGESVQLETLHNFWSDPKREPPLALVTRSGQTVGIYLKKDKLVVLQNSIESANQTVNISVGASPNDFERMNRWLSSNGMDIRLAEQSGTIIDREVQEVVSRTSNSNYSFDANLNLIRANNIDTFRNLNGNLEIVVDQSIIKALIDGIADDRLNWSDFEGIASGENLENIIQDLQKLNNNSINLIRALRRGRNYAGGSFEFNFGDDKVRLWNIEGYINQRGILQSESLVSSIRQTYEAQEDLRKGNNEGNLLVGENMSRILNGNYRQEAYITGDGLVFAVDNAGGFVNSGLRMHNVGGNTFLLNPSRPVGGLDSNGNLVQGIRTQIIPGGSAINPDYIVILPDGSQKVFGPNADTDELKQRVEIWNSRLSISSTTNSPTYNRLQSSARLLSI